MLATKYATIKVIDGDAEKAIRVEAIALDVKAYATDETFLTVDLIVDQIRRLINWDSLDVADQLLVDALLIELKERLVDRLGPDVLPEELRLAVDNVAGWVVSASRMR